MDRRTFTSGLALGLLPCEAMAQGRPDGYRFSPVNPYGLQLTASYWNPIIEQVTAASGVKLTLKIGRTSADTTSYVLAHEVDFAFTNHLFSPERERMGWRVLARRDAPPVNGQIVVLDESPMKSLAQLAEAEIGFPGPEAFIAYKVTHAQRERLRGVVRTRLRQLPTLLRRSAGRPALMITATRAAADEAP